MRPLAVLRPEPGNAATRRRIEAAGGTALALPLFEVVPVAWVPPGDTFDALVLTSANAVRHAGPELDRYRGLPVFAVGPATARTAEAAGLTVAAVGAEGATALAETLAAHGVRHALHLAGRDRATAHLPGGAATAVVYASEARAVPPAELVRLEGGVALIHSPRAARRLAELVADRAALRIAAISEAALAAAGPGWAASAVAPHPSDAALVAAALTLAD